MNIEGGNPVELGKRIALARRARNLSQEEAAHRLGMSRPTYIAIEKGARPIKSSELISFADWVGRSVHDLVRTGTPVTEFVPQFRVTSSAQLSQEAVDAAVDQFRQICTDYLWLEELLGVRMTTRRYPSEYEMDKISPQILADEVATLERSRLNLGQGPLSDIFDVLESEAGLPVFVLPIPEFRIAGIFAFSDALGGCILINGNHPPTRQTWSAAHECGHFLTARYQTEISVLIEYERKPRTEQFADYFAASFLMPSAGLRLRFNNIVRDRGDFTVADLCLLADQYGVSMEAMTRRLERLNCIKPGTWNRLLGSGLPTGRLSEQLNITERDTKKQRLPVRYVRLAAQAFEEERITEGQLAKLLRCSRVEAREIAEARTCSFEVDVAHGAAYQLDLKMDTAIDLAAAERE